MSEAVSVEDAVRIVLENVELTPIEKISILDALGRPVAKDLFCDIDINAFDDAKMDGFAIKAADIANACEAEPVTLKVVDTVGAGYVYQGELKPGEAVRIMTGAAMPKGADAVVKLEDVDFAVSEVVISHALGAGTNVCKAGEHARSGDQVFAAGDVVDSTMVGALASSGNILVPVHRQPKVGVMSIGTELVDSSEIPPMGKKRDSNRYALAAMAKDAGADVTMYPLLCDDLEQIRTQYETAIMQNDFVVSSGGACGGDFDYISQVISSIGIIKFDRIAMRPGKAQTFGVTPDGKLLFGLSGNPPAMTMGFNILVRPAILKAQGFAVVLDTEILRAKEIIAR